MDEIWMSYGGLSECIIEKCTNVLFDFLKEIQGCVQECGHVDLELSWFFDVLDNLKGWRGKGWKFNNNIIEQHKK